MSRNFKDAIGDSRCKWDRSLKDGSGAQCGRKSVDGYFCAQHAQIALRKPLLTDPAVMIAAKMVVESFPNDDMARSDFENGVFDISQIEAHDVFSVLVKVLREQK